MERNFLKAVALSIFALVLLLCMVVYNVGNATGRASLEKRDYGRSLMPLIQSASRSLSRAALPVPPVEYGGYTPTIYAAPADVGSGNGSSEANAMDLATALSTATAGAIIGLIPGVYSRQSPGGESRFAVAWNPSNSGSSGNPIRIVAKYMASTDANSANWSEMQADLITTYGSPAFGSDGRDYIEWYGVYASDESGHSASADDTSVCVLHSADHCVIKYCLIRGDGAKWGANNYHGVTIEDCNNFTVAYNEISNYYTGSVGATNANGCGVMLDHSGGTGLIEHNYLHDCGAGVFHKRSDSSGGGAFNHGNHIVRLNKIVDCEFGVRADSNQSTGETTWTFDVYKNLMVGCNYAAYNGNSSNDLSGDVRFVNNTLVNCTAGHATNQQPYDATAGHKFYNNVVYDPAQAYNWDEWTSGELSSLSTTEFLANYNVWYSAATFMDGDVMSAQSMATMQGLGQDVNSITSDPLFTNYAGGVYTLQAGSPARDLGIDILDLQGGGTSASIHAGCYVTGSETIGIT